MPEGQPTLDGVPLYPCRRAPEHLKTYNQLLHAGLRPLSAARPDGVYLLDGRKVWLYDVRAARSYACTTKYAPAGRHSVETKRQRYTCRSCQRFFNSLAWIRQVKKNGGCCAACRSSGSERQCG
jgi:hypothetical protein